MLFLGPVYQVVREHLEGRINHFPLVRLMMYSLDKTILYLLVFLALRLLWRGLRHKPLVFGHELKVAVFAGYVILLLMLTVFRQWYYPWQLHFYFNHPLADINWQPLVETLKLRNGASQLDFWYQSLGNVVWFVPFGYGLAGLLRKPRLWRVLLAGVGLSVAIEGLQFLLYSGVADIDDLIFNTVGAVLGYVLFTLIRR
ncbi:VanZ family protein [Lacticaseibacillus parakribbianus]|uniref:VanZ family protein n=1 Tax=Lacticaseibacillus parakribbianus TaxID=2970927 RepID=UPI0021CB9976|nr:VanZ family protein [Lacticaseibacillus parakribbianus]